MQQLLSFGLTHQEFWTGIIALCVVGLAYFGQDAARDEVIDRVNNWRWGDEYRRPKKPPTWGSHGNCAFSATVIVSIALCAILR
jgi:hypothetical protein